MSDKVFVDTNIFVYAHDTSAGTKYHRALSAVEELWKSGLGVISTQVLQELCVNLRKRPARPLAVAEIRRLIEDFKSWEVVVNSPASIIAALQIEQRYRISFWDALILNAAEEAGCAVLFTEDLSAGQHYGSVLVVNPFR